MHEGWGDEKTLFVELIEKVDWRRYLEELIGEVI